MRTRLKDLRFFLRPLTVAVLVILLDMSTPSPLRRYRFLFLSFHDAELILSLLRPPQIKHWYYLVYVAWLAFELVFVYFFLVETKVRPRVQV